MRCVSPNSLLTAFFLPDSNSIELDGDHHYSRQGYEHDLTRNTYLSHEHGITILRYENKDVFKFPEMIRAEITNLVKDKLDGLK